MPITLLAFDTIDSTMLEADRQAEGGAHGPLVICAAEQTGGLARHGRRWTSPPGNLYWTMLLDDPADRPRDAALAFAAGLAIIDALALCGVPRSRLQLKWPNDVILDGRKLAGLLVQASVTGGSARIVVGIGINVAFSPGDALFPATSLAEAGLPVPGLDHLRDTLTGTFMARRDEWHRSGLTPLRDAVAACLHGVGNPIRVALDRDRTEIIAGIHEGLDPAGALQLLGDDGVRRAIVAGDVLA